MAQAYKLSPLKAKVGCLWVWGQPRVYSENPSERKEERRKAGMERGVTFMRYFCIMMVSYNLTWGKGISVRNCLQWVDLWACLLGVALIKLIDVGRLIPLWAAPFHRQGLLYCVKSGGAEQSTCQWIRMYSCLSALDRGCDVTACFQLQPPWFSQWWP